MSNNRIYALNECARKFFENKLRGAPLEYLRNDRKLSDKTICRFNLGFAPDDWQYLINYMKKQGFTIEEMVEAKLVCRSSSGRHFSFFRNRIMFPIIDLNNRTIGFGGRVWQSGDTGPKYLNTGENAVFHKGYNLYGLNNINKSGGYIIICEGYMDAIALQSNGIDKAVAGLGTALTVSQALLAKSLSDNIILLYDNDNAGIEAAKAAIETFREVNIEPQIAIISDYKDADEFLKNKSAADFEEMVLSKSLSSLDYQLYYNNWKYNNDPETLFENNLNCVINRILQL